MNSTRKSGDVLYPNSPLAEVASEIRFAPEPIVEAHRYKFYEAIRNDFPNVLVPEARERIAPSLQPYRFETKNHTTGVQISINSLSYYQRQYRAVSSKADSGS
jgi:uncharacterized protein (TIGR04255 family)